METATHRPIEVSYGQIAVFQSTLQRPFNDWTDVHVAQGFAWRPGSVSFATLEGGGALDLDVGRAGPTLDTSRAIRIISVPFEVDPSGFVEIASIADGVVIQLPPGAHRLTFEHGLTESGRMWCRMWFEPAVDGLVEASIIRADASLDPGLPLAMDARPAE
jgi:hypothetical protein